MNALSNGQFFEKNTGVIVVTFLFATISNFKRHEIIADQSFQHGAEMNGVEEIVWLQMYRVVYTTSVS